jgi:dimethylaniline monooxygenase (N-oxide forming)
MQANFINKLCFHKGPSGLTAAKSMLEQNLLPTVFEKNSKIGGIWRMDSGNVWQGMQTNVSKYSCSFSDFPFVNSSKNLFPYASEMCKYLEDYANFFGVTPCLKVNSTVTFVSQLVDDRWLIKWKDSITGEESERVFDFVALSSGMYTTPNIPECDGLVDFRGLVIHSKSYNTLKSQDLAGKKAVIVGASFSGAEISADLALAGLEVTNLFTNPYWILTKVCKYDKSNLDARLPVDFAFRSRRSAYSHPKFESIEDENIYLNNYYSVVFNEQNELPQADLHIDPQSSKTPHVTISDRYMELVKQNRIIAKKGKISRFSEKSVELVDGTVIDADIVIWCTGYAVNLDFMDAEILKKLEYDPTDGLQPLILYKATFRPQLKNIAFVGMLKEPIYAVDELQGRWASLVFSKKLELPDQDTMDKYLNDTRRIRFMKLKPQALDENFTLYSDEMAKEIGVFPNFEEIKQEDPEFFKMIWEGVPSTAIYRYKENKEQTIRIVREAFEIREQYLKENQ